MPHSVDIKSLINVNMEHVLASVTGPNGGKSLVLDFFYNQKEQVVAYYAVMQNGKALHRSDNLAGGVFLYNLTEE